MKTGLRNVNMVLNQAPIVVLISRQPQIPAASIFCLPISTATLFRGNERPEAAFSDLRHDTDIAIGYLGDLVFDGGP